MKTRNFLTASTAMLALAISGTAQAQQAGIAGNSGIVPPGQMKNLMESLNEICATGESIPEKLDCGLVVQAEADATLQDDVLLMAQDLVQDGVVLPGMDTPPEQQLVEALDQGLVTEDMVVPGAGVQAEAEAAPAEVETQAEAAPAEAAPLPQVTEQATEQAEQAVEQTQQAAEQAEQAADQAAEQATDQVSEDAKALADALAAQQDPAAEAGVASDAQVAAEPNVASEADVASDPDVASAEPQAEAAATAEAQAAPQAEPVEQAQTTEPQTETQAEAQVDTQVDTQADSAALADALAAAEAQAQAEAQAAEQAAAGDTEMQAQAEANAQAQADAVAEQDAQASDAVAAMQDGAEEPQKIEETVTADQVRTSSEDFQTTVNAAPEAQAQPTANPDQAALDQAKQDARDAGRDAERARTVAGAALLGLGAVALNEILSNNDKVVSNSGDRVVVENNGNFRVLRNDDVLLRRPGADVTTYQYNDGSTRNVVAYEDGTNVETIRAADGRVLRRARTLSDGTQVVLFDDTQKAQTVVVGDLPQVSSRGNQERVVYRDTNDADALARALAASEQVQVGRTFSLNQVRNIEAVRHLVPEITVDAINFETASAAIRPVEAEELSALGNAMRDMIRQNPSEVFLVEGHTDAVGNYAYNLALSDRRAESVALALTEYFNVPPENMVLQGYGESDLVVPTTQAERANRRASVRRITPLLQSN